MITDYNIEDYNKNETPLTVTHKLVGFEDGYPIGDIYANGRYLGRYRSLEKPVEHNLRIKYSKIM